MLIICILSIIIVYLYCKYRHNVKKDLELVDNNNNNEAQANVKMEHNPSYGPLPNMNPWEKRSHAAYVSSSGSVTLGSAKPLDNDNVRNDNPADNNNTIGTDVKVKPNSPYEMVSARVQTENAAYIPSHASTSLGSAKPLVYTYATTDTGKTASKVTTDNTQTGAHGNINMDTNSAYENIATLEMTANPAYGTTK